ncbi:MAG: HIT domain-containing protein [Bacteroidetes bacterium]|nr:HIT domain-containing protein [Bacteroidota bacterium]
MSSIFTRIIKGEIPSHKIAESEHFIAFLDINPVVKGHTLVVPKEEVDYLFDLDGGTLAGLILFSKKVARALDKSIACKRVGLMVIGTEVPHAHVHLIPFQRESQMNISGPKLDFTKEEMSEIAASIAGNFEP